MNPPTRTRPPSTRTTRHPLAPAAAIPSALFREPDWDWRQSGEVGWWVRPSWREALLGPEGLRLEEWRRQGRLATVKTGPHRVVYRVDLPEGTVYVKHFLVPNLPSVVRQWFRRGKGRNEGKRAARLAAIGVPTITPIALGEQRRRRFLFENYLVTSAIPDSVPLDEFLECRLPEIPEPRRGRLRREVAGALADLTARLHGAGLLHADFHPGNILVRLDETDRPRLAMIDLDALRVRRRVGWEDAAANLALLNHYFWLRSGRADRWRFLVSYLDARGAAPPDRRSFARGIERATRAWAERLWRRWGRRCRGMNKYFESFRGERAWAVASRTIDPTTVRTLMADPDIPLTGPDAVILKDSRTTTVAELTLPVGGQPTRVIYKRFNCKKRLDPTYTLFRPSRAWRAWQSGQHLASRAVPTPANLIVLGRTGRVWRGLPFGRASRETYLVTAKVEPAMTLWDFAQSWLPHRSPEGRRRGSRAMIRALARLMRILHERSLSHRDLKAANILVAGDPAAGEPSLSLIDLVGVQLQHPLSRRRRVQNLARLQVSLADAPGRTRTDALRFLRAYLPWSLTPRDDWKALWREVDAACGRKRARNLSRGRALS